MKKYFLDLDQNSLPVLQEFRKGVISVSVNASAGIIDTRKLSVPAFRGASEPMLGSWNQPGEEAELDQIAAFLCRQEEVTYVCLSALTDPAELVLYHPEVIGHIRSFVISVGSLKNEAGSASQKRLALDPLAAKSFFAWDLKRVLIPGALGDSLSEIVSYLNHPECYEVQNCLVLADLNAGGAQKENLVIDFRTRRADPIGRTQCRTDVVTKRIHN
ncbi:MAG: hypothetical protein ACI4WR_01430 [Bulleidia sp.]